MRQLMILIHLVAENKVASIKIYIISLKIKI
jgi:hypothetical protein